MPGFVNGSIVPSSAEKTLVSSPHRLVQLTLARSGKAAIHFLRTKPLGATGVVIVFIAGLAALADRALGGVLSKRPTKEKIEANVRDARESWALLGPVPGAEGVALEQRFEQACDRAGR